ncbi:phosphoenolpyruvate synthase [Chitinophaga parva]|uniref:Phosphoenolpyruvate synthase n=1 Tax=Chitinophaga parva TaxID=2169414 RepID=A0A2T7BEP2_9BACT|nr:phosphoenolpyruvate synthase [Chitinophaga parva]PUZ23500.1 phosphoenolpyruvate synthase [Chitinophaga parva]
METYIIPFANINMGKLLQVGGKNASLGEMFNNLRPLGIDVPDGFAITIACYQLFLAYNKLYEKLSELLATIDQQTLSNLPQVAKQCRALVENAVLPDVAKQEIIKAYEQLSGTNGNASVAVRSSANAEDSPTASFAGQHDSFLNISGKENLLAAVIKCYVSLFNDRAIKYRIDNGFDHMHVGISVGVQYMVRADKASAGVIFTIEPESGHRNIIYITGAWGLGENVVQGAVDPDEFLVFKPALTQHQQAIIGRKKGRLEQMMIYDESGASGRPVKNVDVPPEKQGRWILRDDEVLQLASWSYEIEKYYGVPMDIEWAKDGITAHIYIVQARPETIHSKKQKRQLYTYKLQKTGKMLCKGEAVGRKIISGRACIIHSLAEADKLEKGDILIADITNPDWNALLRKAVSIVTNRGGRTSHASIVARELGITAIVGTGNATQVISDGQIITVVNAEGDEGYVYEGNIPFEMVAIDLSKVPQTKTKPMLILADPARAFELSGYPAKGVGLLRMEFIINNRILIHPMALVQYDQLPDGPVKATITQMTAGYSNKADYFVSRLAEAIAQVAAAFYPDEVIIRMSDFKTNEYASLVGGTFYEPKEENPMIGFRGASRYYDSRYLPGFGLECRAVLQVRNEMGLTNVKVMIPFCRTLKEAAQVLQTMETFGLKRGENGLQVYVMVEIPSNVILADKFAQLFDGFSIGSNDLTQLTLGLDRDSEIVSHLFDENNEAVTILIKQAIAAAKKAGIKIGLCGQAPSDFPAFSRFLVEQGIDSISFTPDALIRGIENISAAELPAPVLNS